MEIRRLRNLNKAKTIYGYDQTQVITGIIFGLTGIILFGYIGAVLFGSIGFTIGAIISPFIENGLLFSYIYWYLPLDFVFQCLPKSEERFWR